MTMMTMIVVMSVLVPSTLMLVVTIKVPTLTKKKNLKAPLMTMLVMMSFLMPSIALCPSNLQEGRSLLVSTAN